MIRRVSDVSITLQKLLFGASNMNLFLHECLIKARADYGKPHKGATSFHHIVTGYDKDGSPQYRYFDEAEWVAYQNRQSGKKKKEDPKDAEGNKRLTEKTDKEKAKAEESKKKRADSLFIKKPSKVSEVKKGTPLYLKVGI